MDKDIKMSKGTWKSKRLHTNRRGYMKVDESLRSNLGKPNSF